MTKTAGRGQGLAAEVDESGPVMTYRPDVRFRQENRLSNTLFLMTFVRQTPDDACIDAYPAHR